MRKKIMFRFLILLLVLNFGISHLTAQTRINFKRGRTSATVTGALAKGAQKIYVVRAKSGQTLSVKVDSEAGVVSAATRAHSPATAFEYQLEQDGDVSIFLENDPDAPGPRAKFTLTVTIR